MKISVDDQELFSLSETKKNVLKSEIPSDIFDADMKRRLEWVLTHKYEQCLVRLKSEWDSILKTRYEMIPSDDEAIAQLIFTQPDYKDGLAKRIENEAT